jgi:hypothetical protein
VGGTGRAASTGLSAVLLNRGGRYPRRTLFQKLETAGFDYILSLEGPQERYDLEDLSGRFPFVRFILLKETISAGEAVNLAAAELSSPLFFVLWNDHRLFDGLGAARIAELFTGKRLCTAPVVQNSRFETLPTLTSPVFYRGSIKTIPEIPDRENQVTLFPYDWLGVYDRERFIRLGGFDRAIPHPHWQLMDFGFRSCLWGEEIRSTQVIRLIHDGPPPPVEGPSEDSYRLFYLKNLAPVFRLDHAHIPLRRFPGHLARTGWDLLTAGVEFFRERRWVQENRSRFRRDAREVTDLWEHEPRSGEVPGEGP